MRFFDRVFTWLLIFLSGAVCWFWFRVLNWTTVKGQLPLQRNLFIVSNHRTMIDSFFVASVAYFPRGLFRPWLLPYHLAAEENFFRWYCGWLLKRLKSLPVSKGRHDLHILNTVKRMLPDVAFHIFPQAGRQQGEEIKLTRYGLGYLIRQCPTVTVIPVRFWGMEKVNPIGTWFPRIGKRLKLVIGEPLDLAPYLGKPDCKETWMEITQVVVDHINAMQEP